MLVDGCHSIMWGVHFKLDVPETLYGVMFLPRRLNKVLVVPRNAYGLVWVEVIRLVVVR